MRVAARQCGVGVATIVDGKALAQLAPVAKQPYRLVDHLLEHSTLPAPLGFLARWCVGSDQRILADVAQEVVVDRPQRPSPQQRAVKEIAEVFLTELRLRAQLMTNASALGANKGPDQGVAVVSAANPFLAHLAVCRSRRRWHTRDTAARARLGGDRGLVEAQQRHQGVVRRPDVLSASKRWRRRSDDGI